MKLIAKEVTPKVTMNVYIIDHPEEGVLFYKEWIDSNDVVVESTLVSKDGHHIDDPIINSDVWEYVDGLDNNN
jgi:hypothetical protein